jgi:hypothetical protein
MVFLVPKTTRESLVLAASTLVVYFAVAFSAPFETFRQWGDFVAMATIVLVYAPAAIMVLRRPNEGPVPAAVERLIVRMRRKARTA